MKYKFTVNIEGNFRGTWEMTALSKKGMNAPQGDGDQRAFCNDDGDGSENVKKGIGLWGKTTTLHVHDYNVKMPYCTFGGGRKHAMKNFSFAF